ncbi:fungal specific transcription factor domain-containing protein [Microdochium nivale]|nr:fungal specific transcription factor domain-containing protein [Microdochium nivale]
MRRNARSSRIRPHKKSVTGCWTCRRRRVKCDEQKPACQRCLQYGVECSGYAPNPSSAVGHRRDGTGAAGGNADTVTVVSDDRGTIQAYSPTATETRRNSQPGMTAETSVSTWSPDDGCSVSYQPHGFDETTASPPSGADLLSAASARSRHVYQQATPLALPSHTIRSTARDSPNPRQDATYTTPFTQPSPFTLPENDQSRSHDAHITAASAAIGNTRARQRQRREHSHPAPPRTHLDLLSMPSAQKRLIHHWVTFTSAKLVLIDEPTNPCRALMLPMALRGVTASSNTSTADIATFHAICACAAYNLYNLGGSDADHELALAHDQEAIRHLRHNLAQADQHHDQSFAMAIMACITIEAISGSTRRWRTHVTGGLAYLSRLRGRQKELESSTSVGGGGGVARQDDTESDVFATFQAHMVSMAILCGCDDIPGDLKGFLAGSPQRQGMELTFPYYGASSSFLRHQDRMNVLAAATGAGGTGGGGGGGMSLANDDDDDDNDDNVARELDALELQLYLDFPVAPGALGQQEEAQRPGGVGGSAMLSLLPPTHGLVLHHMAQAFYYASLVFCQRCVRRAPLASVQGLIGSGVRQLEAIEAVSGGEAGSVMMWPALVLAAECGGAEDEDVGGQGAAGKQGLQERMLAWFGAKRKFGFKNVEVLQELVQTLWAARRAARKGEDGGDEVRGALGWQEMIREERFDVFRL